MQLVREVGGEARVRQGRESIRSLAAALVLLWLGGWAGATAAADSVPPSNLDPAEFLIMEWNGWTVLSPQALGGRPNWEVIGPRGPLRIDLARERMKQEWDFDTSATLSIFGYVTHEAGRREIEIAGYSEVDQGVRLFNLDFRSASAVGSQLFQGARLADRIVAAHDQANLAALKARRQAIDAAIEATKNLLEETERALRFLYGEALRFTLDPRDVTQAAATIAAAQAKLAAAQQPAAAAKKAKLQTFFAEVAKHQGSIDAWLNQLLAAKSQDYLPILVEVIERDPDEVRQVLQEVREIFTKTASGGLTDDAQLAAMARLVTLAEIVMDLAEDVFVRYEHLPRSTVDRLRQTRQFREHGPQEFQRGARHAAGSCFGLGGDFPLMRPQELLARQECRCGKEETEPVGAPGLATPDPAVLAQARLDWIAAILKDLLRSQSRYDQLKPTVLKNFTGQIAASLVPLQALVAQRQKVDAQITSQEKKLSAAANARETCSEELDVLNNALQTLLMVEFLHKLIDRIPPVTLSLDILDLERGNRLGFEASLLPPASGASRPPAQFTHEFLVSPFGFQDAIPRRPVSLLSFTRAQAPGQSYSPRPGVAALWNYYGRSPWRKSAWRAIAPGLGIAAHFLDFDATQDVEVGLGLVLTLFDDLLHFSYGVNLQGEVDGDREYFAVGVSFEEVARKVQGKDKK